MVLFSFGMTPPPEDRGLDEDGPLGDMMVNESADESSFLGLISNSLPSDPDTECGDADAASAASSPELGVLLMFDRAIFCCG
jgi:hypothetical protein